jgi:hypothetical protein
LSAPRLALQASKPLIFWPFVDMPPSATYTESQPESKTESQSSSGPHITQWLPQLVLAALVSLAVAAIIGISLSAVGFSSPEELRRPGQGIAQSFVMFAVSFLSI